MKAIPVVALAALVAGCATEEKRVVSEIEIEPAHGSLVHETVVETLHHSPVGDVVRVPAATQYMVIGTWRWEQPRLAEGSPCKTDTCPVEIQPHYRQVQRQQVPAEPIDTGEK